MGWEPIGESKKIRTKIEEQKDKKKNRRVKIGEQKRRGRIKS